MDKDSLKELETTMRSQVMNEIERQSKLIFVDEAVFSPVTMLQKSWSLPNDNTKIIDLRTKVKTQAIIAGISSDKGLEHYLIRDRAIANEDFIDFITQIR